MKHTAMIWVAGALLCVQPAMSQEITIKKGKVTMTEAQYKELQRKAAAYDALMATPKSFNDSASYAIGRDISSQWVNQKLGIDTRLAGLAMINLSQGKSLVNDAQSADLLQRFQREFELRQAPQNAKENIEKGEKYLKEISNNKSVYTTNSGLKYRKINGGNGKHPKATDKVKVHYTGKLIDGTVFDSSVQRGEPITFPLNQVIPGWTEGLQIMDEGSKYMLYIPYDLGYGEQAVGSIPPGSTLIFEVELLEVVKRK